MTPIQPSKRFDPNRFRPQEKPSPVLKEKKVLKAGKKPESTLQQLVKIADALHSRELRSKAADKNGFVQCFTCPTRLHWKNAHCGHFITRSCYLLRWDKEVNTKIQCPECNIVKRGNLVDFANNLDKKHGLGTVEKLMKEAKQPFKLDREFVQEIIDKYKQFKGKGK